ncbi:aminodeoxychorismate/anthranilate synthase component II [Candidatus Peregrinibacteria bacterium]|nr:MAG: aminodeoxychorismate/anthranilate synthase component II [Candidatus Peregrinibacteria bacterium]
MKNILLIDNFDSFTFNLVDFFETAGGNITIFRNDVAVENIRPEKYDLLIISPGPSVPKNAGNLMKIIEKSLEKVPIFGVCLGHEALAEVFGGSLKFVLPVHGRSTAIHHDEKTIFENIPQDFSGGRYHSLAVDAMPKDFEISATTKDGIIMAMRHKTLPIESVQFHPESVLTMKKDSGMNIVRNVMRILTR